MRTIKKFPKRDYLRKIKRLGLGVVELQEALLREAELRYIAEMKVALVNKLIMENQKARMKMERRG